jgi:radical SAM protein with 4Fe4S-binding SPASM domain
VFIQLHNNGEPLLYPQFTEALELFTGHYTGLNTNGKLLLEQADAITAYLSTITISIIPDDPEGDEQLDIAQQFIEFKSRPLVVFRMLGHIDSEREYLINKWAQRYEKVLIVRRILHSPDGSFNYERKVTKPEIGVCLEMLHKLAIDRYGNVFPCVRFDPHKKNLIGNVTENWLTNIWRGEKRRQWIQHHIEGRRDLVPLCKTCDFWGCPTS